MRLVKALYLGFSEPTVKKNQLIWDAGKRRAKTEDKTMSKYIVDLIENDVKSHQSNA